LLYDAPMEGVPRVREYLPPRPRLPRDYKGLPMLKTPHRSLLPAALLSAFVGLAGCHVSIGSGSSSHAPGSVHGKPAHKTPSKSARASKPTSKPIHKASSKPTAESKPASDPVRDKTTEGPHRDQPDTSDPKRTQPTNDPKRTQPASDPARTPKRFGGRNDDGGDDEGGAGASRLDRPGSVTTTTKDDGGAKEIDRPGTLVAPK
jgi:hypothetical protein